MAVGESLTLGDDTQCSKVDRFCASHDLTRAFELVGKKAGQHASKRHLLLKLSCTGKYAKLEFLFQ